MTSMLLGIAGLKYSGKNTAAQFLEEWCAENNFRARSQGLADALKVSVARAFGFDGSVEECIEFCDVLKRKGVDVVASERIEGSAGPDPEAPYSEVLAQVTGREFLQFYGTEAHRDVFDYDFWINYLIPDDAVQLCRRWDEEDPHSSLLLPTDLMMVTDVRFPNEAERVHQLNGFVVEIRKPGSSEDDGHASERPLPRSMVDEEILNDATLDYFRSQMFDFGERRIFKGLSDRSGVWS